MEASWNLQKGSYLGTTVGHIQKTPPPPPKPSCSAPRTWPVWWGPRCSQGCYGSWSDRLCWRHPAGPVAGWVGSPRSAYTRCCPRCQIRVKEEREDTLQDLRHPLQFQGPPPPSTTLLWGALSCMAAALSLCGTENHLQPFFFFFSLYADDQAFF